MSDLLSESTRADNTAHFAHHSRRLPSVKTAKRRFERLDTPPHTAGRAHFTPFPPFGSCLLFDP